MGETLPHRFERPGVGTLIATLLGVWLVVFAFTRSQSSFSALADGLPQMGEIIRELFPPDFTRVDAYLRALAESFAIALSGTIIGCICSLFISPLASERVVPRVIATAVRSLLSTIRTVPELVWALLFVASVGLGPFAGTLTIAVETIGFCGRFYSQAFDLAPRGPGEALRVIGATRIGTFMSCTLPLVRSEILQTSLFSLEKAVRGSVVLGIVGAGGIGIELKVAMDSFRFAEASAIILCILVLVIALEQMTEFLRRRIAA